MSSPVKKRIQDRPVVAADDEIVDALIEKIKDLKTSHGEAHALVKKILRAYYQRVWHKMATTKADDDGLFDGGLHFMIEMESAPEYSSPCDAKHIPSSGIGIIFSAIAAVRKTHTVKDIVELGAPFDDKPKSDVSSDA